VELRTDGSQDESGSPPIVIAKIPLDDHVSDIVTSPNDSIAYAALSDSIAVIGSDLEFSCVIPIGGNPRDLTIDVDGSRLYATNYGGSVSVVDIAGVEAANALGGGRISVIAAGGAMLAAIAAFDGYAITDLAADSDTNRFYVGLSRQSAYYQYDTGLVGVIDTATNTVIRTIDLGAPPDTVTISPDGSMMYATHYDHGLVTAIDLDDYSVTPIPLGDSPLGVNLTPDGLQVYVSNRGSLSVIDTVTNEAAQIPVGDLPRCVRTSPDGKSAYVSNYGDGSVSVIDTIAQCVTDTIDVGGHPEALTVSADGHRLYVGDYWSGTVTVFSVQP
jgi:YVTN family beta-propeller protein